MRKRYHEGAAARPRLLVLVDESNIGSSVRTAGRGLDWLKLRDFLAGPATGRDLIEMVVYAGLPVSGGVERRFKTSDGAAEATYGILNGRPALTVRDVRR